VAVGVVGRDAGLVHRTGDEGYHQAALKALAPHVLIMVVSTYAVTLLMV
jgi:hypothetical protein